MLKSELEKIAGRPFTPDQYDAINAVYMVCSLDKYAFVKKMRRVFATMPAPAPDPDAVRPLVIGIKGPAGTYFTGYRSERHTILARIVNVDIKSGRLVLDPIPGSYAVREYCDRVFWDDSKMELIGADWSDDWYRKMGVQNV